MSHRAVRIVFSTVLALGVADLAHAQSSLANPNVEQNNQKKHPNQVPDAGPDTDPADDPADGRFEKAIDNLSITLRPDGTLAAQLDDSFMEVMTVSLGSSGSLQFSHFTGLDAATRAVTKAALTPRILPSRTLPALFPILEEKE